MCKTHFSLLVCTLLVLCGLIGGQPTVEIEAEHAETVPNRAFINKIQFDEAFHQLESKLDELRNRIDGLQDDCVTNDKKNHYSTEGRFKCVSGEVMTTSCVRNSTTECILQSKPVKFQESFSKTPAVLLAIRGLDAREDINMRVRVHAENVTDSGFIVRFHTWSNSVVYNVWSAWMACGV